ncbi:Cullin repeat-like-containing domain protein [Umbelopsis sp. AD052]|nr:Cullin repeat-like-containing domain protein [Umbelopsis sp. AD052]
MQEVAAAIPQNPPFAGTTGQRQVDLAKFGDPNFNPESYMRASVADVNEEQLRAFYRSLNDAKTMVGSDLQRNVYRNYTEFVVISKEISNLDGDMLLLRDFLNELRVINASFKDEVDPMAGIINDPAPIAESITQRRKPSEMATADMQTIYRAQLASLWESIEGSQRLLPFAPDRHIVRDFSNFVELHPKTLQARQATQLVLLNDCILVASKKKRTMSSKVKLVADRCWELDKIRVADVKNTSDLTNALKIIHYNDEYLFRCERPEDKMSLLVTVKRVTDELLESSKQNDADAKLSVNGKHTMPQLASSDVKWLSELPDELEVFIAIREFEDAVAYIEKARAILSSFSSDPGKLDGVKEEIDTYVYKLSKAIGRDLSNSLLTKVQFQRNVNWLLRLGLGETGREMFLATRSGVIKRRIRQLTFEGDVTTYINELSLVVFTLVRNTCEWYRDSFKDNRMASGFITWVKEQITIYAQIFNKQVFGQNSLNLRVISDCLRSTAEQCSLLRKVGLDLKFMLDDIFAEEIKKLIIAYEERAIGRLDKIIKEDKFLVVSSQSLGTYSPSYDSPHILC